LLQLNLFERRNFIELFKPPDTQPIVSPQILLWAKLWDSSDWTIQITWHSTLFLRKFLLWEELLDSRDCK